MIQVRLIQSAIRPYCKPAFNNQVMEHFCFGNMQIMREIHFLKQVRGPDPNYKDICFSGAGR